MRTETKRKRKRGRRPKTGPPETTALDNNDANSPPTTSAAENKVVFSINNVELIDDDVIPCYDEPNVRRRGRPRKIPKPETSITATNAKTLPVSAMANGAVSTALINAESAVARVLPAMDAVVKVFCVHTEPNFSLPWQRKRQYSSSSSGFVIKGRRVLTNAHSVEHYTQVKLKKRGSDMKYVATVLAIGTECDIVSMKNVELINPIYPASSFHHHHCLPPPPIETSRSEPKTLSPAIFPITDRSALINAESGVDRVVSNMDSVVKIFCVHSQPNLSMPWQMKRQYSTTSSGLVIKGWRVLTNAHCVAHYTHVKLRKRDTDTKYVATVLAIGTQCDIALLTVDDDEFWEGVSPVEFGDLPALQDAVTVVGYPIGGDTISVTSGVVSRIEILSYVHGSTELLGLQIDAAINSGNSGGPAFNDKGNCVGIAFQSLKHDDVENIGYVIPTPVIMHFIQDYEKNGTYTGIILGFYPLSGFLSSWIRVWGGGGFPILGVEWQKMENPDLRLSMGMKPDQKGVRIRRIDPTAPEFKVLKPSDIILSFDGVNIANDGTVPFRHGERIGFSYLVSQKYTGDNAAIEVLRNSKILKFNVKLATHRRLIPAHNKGRPPSYYIIAGFVFTTVSVPYLRSEYGKDYEYEAPVKLLDKLLHEMPQSPEEQIVVVSQVLVADINIGYEDIVNTQVLALNGQPVKNLKSLANMVENCNDEYLKFDLEYQQIVVLQTKTAKAATLDILSTHCIPSAMSDDLKI
ncbi:hypothetical protein DH2020_019313 [Rehmannia glutinosa]|uniref:Protease Do-like protein n=1 Tax=Rehmannia glutinosa TaxID=99300 RepID=A0ABR0WLG7_REHGL